MTRPRRVSLRDLFALSCVAYSIGFGLVGWGVFLNIKNLIGAGLCVGLMGFAAFVVALMWAFTSKEFAP